MRWRVFGLTWLSYASYYLTRKPFSVAKKSIQNDLDVGDAALAHIDTGYLSAYALGQFAAGLLADRVGARRVIVAGTLLTAGCAALFGGSSLVWVFALLWIANGFALATGWSPNIKVMTAWFPVKGRGTVMGFWTTNYVVGGLAAGPIAAFFLNRLGWRWGFFGPAILVSGVALALLAFLPRRPPASPEEAGGSTPIVVTAGATDEERRAARRRLLGAPLLWALGASYFFMKAARYMLLFWLIKYMQDDLGYSNWTATLVAMGFELGGAVATIGVGWMSERVGARRVPVGVTCLLLLAAAIPAWALLARHGIAWNVVGLVFVGVFLFGPDALLSATAAQDLGGPLAAATAAGIINGVGSLGPIVASEYFTGFRVEYGWTAGFFLLGAGALASAVILVPFWRRA